MKDINVRLNMSMIDLADNSKLVITNVAPVYPEGCDTSSFSGIFKDSFTEKYKFGLEYALSWDEIDSKHGQIMGRVNILPIIDIVQKLSNANYSPKHYDNDDPIRDFYVVDEFCSEAGVGIYGGKHATNSLYYFDIDETPQYLGLDFLGYLEMLISSNGFIYWQKSILAIRANKTNPACEKFKEHMPRLFPGWTWEEFADKYESLKIEEAAY